MSGVNDVIRARLSSEVALINEIGHHLIAAGGKRLRPALVLLSARSLGCADGSIPRLLAAVIEFIHTATLLHDDVVDHSDLRRGKKTANAVWGNAGAVLSGDFLYSRSFQLMVEVGIPEVMRVMADTTNAVAEGEVLQLMNQGDPEVDELRYLRVIELKTAVLFGAAAEIGALAAGADPEQRSAMSQYGHDLGMCYQLIDDVLDYRADPEESGKALGNDLSEGKPTLPLIQAMKRGSEADALVIRRAISDGQTHDLEQIMAIVERNDSIEYTRNMACSYADSARRAITKLPESDFKTALEELCQFATLRKA